MLASEATRKAFKAGQCSSKNSNEWGCFNDAFLLLHSKIITLPLVYLLWIIIKQRESQQKFIFKDQIKYTSAHVGIKRTVRVFPKYQTEFSHAAPCPSSGALGLVIRYISPVCFSISTNLENKHTHTYPSMHSHFKCPGTGSTYCKSVTSCQLNHKVIQPFQLCRSDGLSPQLLSLPRKHWW